jgi:hypothetical protein
MKVRFWDPQKQRKENIEQSDPSFVPTHMQKFVTTPVPDSSKRNTNHIIQKHNKITYLNAIKQSQPIF